MSSLCITFSRLFRAELPSSKKATAMGGTATTGGSVMEAVSSSGIQNSTSALRTHPPCWSSTASKTKKAPDCRSEKIGQYDPKMFFMIQAEVIRCAEKLAADASKTKS